MRVLAIGAHFDDVELGCGGTLLAQGAAGHTLGLLVATRSGYARPDGTMVRADETARREGCAAAAAMGATLFEGNLPTFGVGFDEKTHAMLLDCFDRFAPDVVLTHWPGDAHHDHRQLGLATIHCARRIGRVLTYRSNWDSSAERFEPRFFVDIETTLEGKLDLLAHHASEMTRTGGRWRSAVQARARDHGERAGCLYAEGFEVVRWRSGDW
ncbi:MAG: PIG-L family deacetylase [Myxococcota bacterium]